MNALVKQGNALLTARLHRLPILVHRWAKRFAEALLRGGVVGATGFEPVTSSVSGHARPFARPVAALQDTTSALFRTGTEPGTAVRPRMGSLLTNC